MITKRIDGGMAMSYVDDVICFMFKLGPELPTCSFLYIKVKFFGAEVGPNQSNSPVFFFF